MTADITATITVGPQTIALELIHPDPDNIRDDAHDDDIPELAADIAEHGLLQPIVVYPVTDTADSIEFIRAGHYIISAGHRRYLAVHSLGWTDVAVNVINPPADDLQRLDLMAAENLTRRQLVPLEEANLYKRYVDAGQTQLEIATRLHITQSRVSDYLSILELSPDVLRRLRNGTLSFYQARNMVKTQRAATGRARGDMGGNHHRGHKVPYFISSHPLYQNAASRCANRDHDPVLRLGGACGECWETVIRIDAGGHAPLTNEPDTPPHRRRPIERFADPRDILRRIKCTRCGVGALDRPGEQRCNAVRGGKRVLFDRHEFPMEVTPSDATTGGAADA